MSYHYLAKHRVEFFETDLAGIVHFANFYRFMEQAEHEFFRSMGLKIHATLPDGTVFGWPRVSATCSFKSPAYYEDEVEIRITILRLTRRSLTMTYEFQRDGVVLALGEMKTAFCVFSADGKLASSEMPDDYFEKLTRDSIA
ncbi:acyl-CoA thioesterase [Schlesneria paludicola]|uniref:acyl-CoA thioesterase n=1 Tax=Schlesneria paludicola TaxID=360056 RepID=UPI00029A3AE7|nr:thioesterase family protein [Schlesneria paludicola]